MTISKGALALCALTAFASSAHAYSDRVKKACAGDYQNFCSQYVPESSAARACFESNRKSLSQYCITAMIDAGLVPKKYLKK